MSKRIYFLGIGGTLMGSLALLADEAGYTVSGSDKALYPPMSDQLRAAGITVFEGFDPSQLDDEPDLVVIGNAGLPRGHEGVEAVLERGLTYTSGAEFLGRELLQGRWVIAVSGTHGKTTTASMVAWILEYAGMNPGYLIGGVPSNFERSARLGDAPFFVVEADEYDTSYFDRRSKFLHYRPRTLVINNLEFDHADIFDNLAAIQNQFHLLLRTVPKSGLIIAPADSDAVNDVIAAGCWSELTRFGGSRIKTRFEQDNGEHWQARSAAPDGSRFDVAVNDEVVGTVEWSLIGEHNVNNALAAVVAARHAGVPAKVAVDALNEFRGVKRRMELIAERDRLKIYDDFAHHPSAIRSTLQGLRRQAGSAPILAVIEPRTHTMSLGTLRDDLATCTAAADEVFFFRSPQIRWDLGEVVKHSVVPAQSFDDIDNLIGEIGKRHTATLAAAAGKTLHVLIMSNGSFDNIYGRLPAAIDAAASS